MSKFHSSYIKHLLNNAIDLDVEPGDEAYKADSTPVQTMKSLQRGKIHIHKRYSFRGLSTSEADALLDKIMVNTPKASCYLLIHGKGIGSCKQKPKIKYLLQNKLYGHPQVIAYCEATIADGGAGAMYVMLSGYLPR